MNQICVKSHSFKATLPKPEAAGIIAIGLDPRRDRHVQQTARK